MRKSAIILVLVFVALHAHAALADSNDEGSGRLSRWLGPQKNDDDQVVPVVGKTIDRKKHSRLSKYEISLRVLPGSKVRLCKSSNPIVTFDGEEFIQLRDFQPNANETYLLGKIHLNAKLGWRIYNLNARVTSGRLKGAIVHFRDGRIQDSISDPCFAVYRVPKEYKVEEGDVSFEIVSLFAK